MALQLLDGLGRVLVSTGEADLYEIGDDDSGDDKKKVYAKPKNSDPVTAYVETAQLPSHETVSIPQTFAGLDAVAVPTRLRYQLFTITKVSEQDDYVEVVATHIFYEQINNFTMWEPETLVNYSCGAICRNVLRNQIGNDGGFRVVTDCTDELPWHQIDYARKNIVEAFLNPEDGICTRFNLSMIRDNMDFYVLKNVGYDRGMVIEDGLNLLGIEREENIENVITRVAAYGRDSDGDLVWLNNNGNRYVDSPHINEYARPRVELYDTGIQITGAKEAEELHNQGRDNEIITAENINAKILAKALERFSKDEVDIPEVTMNIDFVSLGDTEEYKQYRDLDKVFLYDIVHVKDKRRDYNYAAQVIGVEHDVLTGTLLSVTIGNLTTWDGVRKVANWQVPEIDGSIIRLHSITSSQYAYESITTEAIKDNSVTGSKVNVQSVSQALDLNSLKSILAQAGLVLNDQGILIYQNTDDNMLGSRLEVQGRRIGMVIGTYQGQDYIKAGEIALAFNSADESVAHINADHVNISATSTLHSLAGAIEEDDNGNVTIVSAGGMRVRKTSGGITSEFGVFDNDNLTAGVIVDKVNNGTVTLKGSKVWVGDASTDQTLKKWATESDGLFAQNIGVLSARIGTIEADYITTDNITSKVGSSMNFTVGRLTASEISTPSLTVGGKYLDAGLVVYDVYATTGSDGTITLYYANGTSRGHEIISFSRATLTSLTGSWSGATYTASAMDSGGTVLATVSTNISRSWNGTTLNIVSGSDTLLTESITGGTGTGMSTQGTLYTINSFNSSHRAYGYVDSSSNPAGRLFSFNVDASGEYSAGRTAGIASVTLSKGAWSSGSITVTASNGAQKSVSFPAVTMDQGTFSGHKKWVYAYSNEAGISGYVQRLEVDATSEYTAGQTAGVASVTVSSAGWQGGSNVVTASNGASVTVSMPTVTMSGGNWASHKKTVFAYSSEAGISGYIASLEVDATSEYTAGQTNGRAGVTLSAAGWSGGSNIVSASNGESVTITMPVVTMSSGSWANHKKTVYAYSSAAGITGYIASEEVDATSEYTSGVTAGEGKFSKAALTLQGTAETIYPVGTVYRYSNLPRYKGDGGTIYARGNTQAAYVGSESGSYYLRGTAINRKYSGTLYTIGSHGEPISQGNGSWFLAGQDTLYYGNGARLGTTTLYKGDGGTYVARGTSESVLVPDASGSIYRYASGAAITRYTAGTSYTADTSPYYTKNS